MAKMTESKPEYVIGVDMGGTKILAGVLDSTGKILAEKKTRTYGDRGANEVIQRIIKAVNASIKSSGVAREDITALGIGSPGPLNSDTGVVETMPNLPGWENVPLKTVLEQHLGVRVFIENDVNVGTYGEYRLGAGVGFRSAVGIFLGTGIGGGLIIDKQLYRGFNRVAGEIGHMVIKAEDGPKCNCGRVGCYEALAGRLSIVKRIQELAEKSGRESLAMQLAEGEPSNVRSSILARAWNAGDEAVVQALKELSYYTGIAIANVMNFLNPEIFILGGGIMEALGKDLLPLIQDTAHKEAFATASRNVPIRSAMLGDYAGLIGAAFLAMERARTSRKKRS
ncbi:MAG: ROK family protein [Candidatus Sumerlaeia bacterium]